MPMERLTPFAQMPTTPEPIIAQVRRQLAEDDRFGVRVPSGVLDRAADRAVRELWGSPVKTFVPILALRQAREILQDQDVVLATQWPERRHAEGTRTAGRPQSEWSPGDRIPIEGDALPHDEGDVLSF
jgi:hypothetical protein